MFHSAISVFMATTKHVFLRLARAFAMTVILSGLAGCSAKKITGPTLLIDPSCVTKTIQILNCDLGTEPPHCSGPAIVNYKKGCGRIQVKP